MLVIQAGDTVASFWSRDDADLMSPRQQPPADNICQKKVQSRHFLDRHICVTFSMWLLKCRKEVGEGNGSDDGSCQVRLGSSESMEGSAEKDHGMCSSQCNQRKHIY